MDGWMLILSVNHRFDVDDSSEVYMSKIIRTKVQGDINIFKNLVSLVKAFVFRSTNYAYPYM